MGVIEGVINPWQLPYRSQNFGSSVHDPWLQQTTAPFYKRIILVYLSKGGSMIYHVTQTYTTYEYYRVEADSADKAIEMVNECEVDAYNWDQTYEGSDVEPAVE